ncbi:hypothetical protein D5085_18055 [Ectothiorhodospiraceae bacterium BW-2]|nr:hypothetical protein D5085_18055 [Ectothiorhodospiraceae bacterium BW-2]
MMRWLQRVVLSGLLFLSGCVSPTYPDVSGTTPERGLGGTGVLLSDGEERGLGGTGVMGTLTAFGSIWVNGLHIELDEQTYYQRNGRPSTVASLALGQQLRVVARGRATEPLVATEVEIIDQLRGPVSHYEAADKLLIVLGQTVRLEELSAVSSTYKAGEWLRISGLRSESGEIYATSIEPIEPAAMVLLRGVVTEQPDGQTTIGQQPLLLPQPSSWREQAVVVRGEYRQGILRTTTIEPELSLDSLQPLRQLSIEQRRLSAPRGEGERSLYPLMGLHRLPFEALPPSRLKIRYLRYDPHANRPPKPPFPLPLRPARPEGAVLERPLPLERGGGLPPRPIRPIRP